MIIKQHLFYQETKQRVVAQMRESLDQIREIAEAKDVSGGNDVMGEEKGEGAFVGSVDEVFLQCKQSFIHYPWSKLSIHYIQSLVLIKPNAN